MSENLATKDLVNDQFYLDDKKVTNIDDLLMKSERQNIRSKKVSESIEMHNRY
jgi:hypothetical protein